MVLGTPPARLSSTKGGRPASKQEISRKMSVCMLVPKGKSSATNETHKHSKDSTTGLVYSRANCPFIVSDLSQRFDYQACTPSVQSAGRLRTRKGKANEVRYWTEDQSMLNSLEVRIPRQEIRAREKLRAQQQWRDASFARSSSRHSRPNQPGSAPSWTTRRLPKFGLRTLAFPCRF